MKRAGNRIPTTEHVPLRTGEYYKATPHRRRRIARALAPIVAIGVFLAGNSIGTEITNDQSIFEVLKSYVDPNNLSDVVHPKLPNTGLLSQIQGEVSLVTTGYKKIGSTCTAVAYRSRLITAGHCIVSSKTGTYETSEIQKPLETARHGVSRYETIGDIAMGKFSDAATVPPNDTLSISSLRSDKPTQGTRFYTAGYPGGFDRQATATNMVYLGYNAQIKELIFAVMPNSDGSPGNIIPGDSGSPIVDDEGHFTILRDTQKDSTFFEHEFDISLPPHTEVIGAQQLTADVFEQLQTGLSK